MRQRIIANAGDVAAVAATCVRMFVRRDELMPVLQPSKATETVAIAAAAACCGRKFAVKANVCYALSCLARHVFN